MTASSAAVLLASAALFLSLDDSGAVLRGESIELVGPGDRHGKVTLSATEGGGLDIRCESMGSPHGTVSLYGKDGGFELVAIGAGGAQIKVRLAGDQSSLLLQGSPGQPAIDMISMREAAEISFLGGELEEGSFPDSPAAVGVSSGSGYIRLGSHRPPLSGKNWHYNLNVEEGRDLVLPR